SRNFNPKIITIGIGGNDAGFGSFLNACLQPLTCEYARPGSPKATQLAVQIASNKQRLVRTYEAVKSSAPDAAVYVHGYPIFIRGTGGSCGLNVGLSDEERQLAAGAIRYMNQVVRAAAKEAGVIYIDVEDIFEGGRLCDDGSKYFNGITAGND